MKKPRHKSQIKSFSDFLYSHSIFTDKKIITLFKDRKINMFCIDMGINPEHIIDLVEIQRHVYNLDFYGEQSWLLNQIILDNLWSELLKSITSMDIEYNSIKRHVDDIKKYQHIEENMRIGILTTDVPIDYYYYLKTCDVRLSRNILMEKSKNNPNQKRMNAWYLYDLASEVIDDLTDWKEDLGTFNGNRYLQSVILKGHTSTIEDYMKFIKNITESLKDYDSGIIKDMVRKRTLEAIELLINNERLLERIRVSRPYAKNFGIGNDNIKTIGTQGLVLYKNEIYENDLEIESHV